jgi:hypothetical protein
VPAAVSNDAEMFHGESRRSWRSELDGFSPETNHPARNGNLADWDVEYRSITESPNRRILAAAPRLPDSCWLFFAHSTSRRAAHRAHGRTPEPAEERHLSHRSTSHSRDWTNPARIAGWTAKHVLANHHMNRLIQDLRFAALLTPGAHAAQESVSPHGQ